MKETETFSSFKKTVGPPNYWYSVDYDPLDKNEYLLKKEVDIEAIKARNDGKALVEVHHWTWSSVSQFAKDQPLETIESTYLNFIAFWLIQQINKCTSK